MYIIWSIHSKSSWSIWYQIWRSHYCICSCLVDIDNIFICCGCNGGTHCCCCCHLLWQIELTESWSSQFLVHWENLSMRYDVFKKKRNRFHTFFLPFSLQTFGTAASAGHHATSNGAFANVSQGFAIDWLSTSSIWRVVLDGLYGFFMSSTKETSSV